MAVDAGETRRRWGWNTSEIRRAGGREERRSRVASVIFREDEATNGNSEGEAGGFISHPMFARILGKRHQPPPTSMILTKLPPPALKLIKC